MLIPRLASNSALLPASTRLSSVSSRPPRAAEVPAMYLPALPPLALLAGGNRLAIRDFDRGT